MQFPIPSHYNIYDAIHVHYSHYSLLILFQAVLKSKVTELSSTVEAAQTQLACQRKEALLICEKETARANSLHETVRNRFMYI